MNHPSNLFLDSILEYMTEIRGQTVTIFLKIMPISKIG
jgi:hypothetical protein